MNHLKYLKQEGHFFTIDPRNGPVLTIKPGETVVVETMDNVNGQIKTERDLATNINPDELNPLSGPIYVEGSEKGDTLAIHIDNIEIASDQGWTGFVPSWIYWDTRDLKEPVPALTKICRIKDNLIYFPLKDGRILQIPAKPMIGTIGTAPEREGLSALTLGRYGGNLDSPDVCAGSTLYLPVFVKGALLHLGDVHAIQGDAELNAAPVEVPAKCTLTVSVVKGKSITWPWIETPEYFIAVGASKPLDDALKIALKEMILWLNEEHGFNIWDASVLIASVATVQACGAANPLFSMALKFPKKYLTKKT